MANQISLKQAQALASAGDADAQYALSSVLHDRGQFDESLHWLRLAAKQNLAPARMTLATLLMDGRRCARDRQQAIELLQPLAATEPHANLLLSELHGFAALGGAGGEAALRYLAAAARMGDAGALRQLGLLGAWHRRWDLARPLLDASARRGDAAAAHALAGLDAEHSGGAEEGAHPLDWPLLERSLPQLAADIELPAVETLNGTPLVRRFRAVIPPLVLDFVIRLAAPLVQRSMIVDARTGEMRADPMRTSSHVTLGPREHDHVLEAIERCISRVSGLPALNGEFLQILRYRPGEEFRPHVDYFNESGASAYRSLADGGQRAQTVLLYLNADYTGGGTFFSRLRLQVEPRPGDLLHFHNLAADGLGHQDSLHAGLPVVSGEKWLLSQWIRSERYPARLAW
jgi:prolyl 4-hydroxylase